MIITEYDIVDLYDAAREAMGDEAADLLMRHLGVSGWPRDYVHIVRVPSGPTLIAGNAALRVEIERLRSEIARRRSSAE